MPGYYTACILYYTIQYHIILYYIILFYFTLHYIKLHHITSYHIIYHIGLAHMLVALFLYDYIILKSSDFSRNGLRYIWLFSSLNTDTLIKMLQNRPFNNELENLNNKPLIAQFL